MRQDETVKQRKGRERRGKREKTGKCLSVGIGQREKSHRKCRRQTKQRYYWQNTKSAGLIDKLEKSRATSPTRHRKDRASWSTASKAMKNANPTPFYNPLSPMQIPHPAKPTCLTSPSEPLHSPTPPFHCVVHHSSTPSSSSPQQASSNAPFPTPS